MDLHASLAVGNRTLFISFIVIITVYLFTFFEIRPFTLGHFTLAFLTWWTIGSHYFLRP